MKVKSEFPLLHWNEQKGMYKTLKVLLLDGGDVLLEMAEGKKGGARVRLVFSLTYQELCTLARIFSYLADRLAPAQFTKRENR